MSRRFAELQNRKSNTLGFVSQAVDRYAESWAFFCSMLAKTALRPCDAHKKMVLVAKRPDGPRTTITAFSAVFEITLPRVARGRQRFTEKIVFRGHESA